MLPLTNFSSLIYSIYTTKKNQLTNSIIVCGLLLKPLLQSEDLFTYQEHHRKNGATQNNHQFSLSRNTSSHQLILPLTRALYPLVPPHYSQTIDQRQHHQQRQLLTNNMDQIGGSCNEDSTITQDHHRRHCRRKDRKKHWSRTSRSRARRGHPAATTTRDPEVGLPTSYRIACPPRYADTTTTTTQECSMIQDYAHSSLSSAYHSEPESNGNNALMEETRYLDQLGVTVARGSSNNHRVKRHLHNNHKDNRYNRLLPSTPSIANYTELLFRDVGREIDV